MTVTAFTIKLSDIQRCPLRSLSPRHYRPDGSCVCPATLVCPRCGGDRLGTIERAEIWQPAVFTVQDDEGEFENERGDNIGAEWSAYMTDDVGDTDTVGFCCRDCLSEWRGVDGAGPIPFVPRRGESAARG